MKTKTVAIGMFVLLAMLAPARADDLADLQKAFEEVSSALEGKNLDQLIDAMHPEVVIYGPGHLFPIDRKTIDQQEWARMFDDMFARIISAGFTKKNVQFRVIGQTGLVWGDTRLAVDSRSGEESGDQDSRLSVIFVKHEGRWVVAHWHDSLMPIGARSLLRN